jgi:hypothetical protein
MRILKWILALGAGSVCLAQTVVNGSRTVEGTLKVNGPASAVDFSQASNTKPAKSGTVANLPAGCTAGDVYFALDAAAGQNLYFCTATNTWTQQSGTGSGGGANPGGVTGSLQKNGGGGTLSGQAMIFSGLYGGGTERQLGMNCTPKMTVPYTAFTAASTSQQIKVATVPAYWFPTAILVNEATAFACSGCSQVSAMAASLGTLSSPAYYVQPLTAMQSGANFKADNVNGQPASLGTHDLYLQLGVTNPNPGNLGSGSATSLTAGAFEVVVCGGTWQ